MPTKFKQQEIQFTCNHLKLSGTLHLPDNHTPDTPCIIGSHGLFSDASSPKQIALAHACNEKNMAYFRFDHRGCGKSEGDFKSETTITNRFNDFCAAIQTIKGHPETGNPMGFFGSSLGGAIVLLAALSKAPYAAMVTLSAPISMNSVWDVLVKNNQDQLLCNAFYDEAIQFNINNKLHQINNILVFHGTQDEVVPVSNAKNLFNAVRDPKELYLFERGCHQLSDKNHQALFIKKTVDWFDYFTQLVHRLE